MIVDDTEALGTSRAQLEMSKEIHCTTIQYSLGGGGGGGGCVRGWPYFNVLVPTNLCESDLSANDSTNLLLQDPPTDNLSINRLTRYAPGEQYWFSTKLLFCLFQLKHITITFISCVDIVGVV